MAWSDEPTEMQLGTIYSWIRWYMTNEEAGRAVAYLEEIATRRDVSNEIKRLKDLKTRQKLTLDEIFKGAIWRDTRMSEAELQKQVAIYIRLQYPDVIFHSDFGSGVKLTPWQAKMQKMQNGGKRAWPDMFIAEPKGKWHGLFIELKKEGTRLLKRDGDFASEHIAEQDAVLRELNEKGYKAEFAIGFEQALNLIDDYLGGK